MNNSKWVKFSFLIGFIAFFYYFILMETLGVLWPGYSSTQQHMSELGGVDSPFKNIMNIFGFMGIGVMILAFSFGFWEQFNKNPFMRAATFFLVIAGLFMIITGFLPCDAKCIDVTFTGKLHSMASIPPSIALPIAVILSGFGFGRQKKWGKKWFNLSILLGGTSMATGMFMSVPSLYVYVGILQRLGIGLSLIWMMLVSRKVLTSTN